MTGSLSTQQVECYWRDGFLFPLRVMDAAAAGANRRELEEIEARCAEHLEDGTYFFSNAHFVLPFADRLNRHPVILDAVGLEERRGAAAGLGPPVHSEVDRMVPGPAGQIPIPVVATDDTSQSPMALSWGVICWRAASRFWLALVQYA